MTEMSFLEHLQELRKRLIISLMALVIGMAVAWPLTSTVQRFMQQPLLEPSLVQKWQFSLSSYFQRQFPRLSRSVGLDPSPPKVTPHKLYYTAPLEAFFVQMKISVVTGLVLALPVILYQLWLFFAPALYPSERKYVYLFIPFGTVAFVLGDLFFLYGVWPLIISFSLAYESDILSSWLNLTQFINFCLGLMLLFGLIFELPLVLLLLARVGLVTRDFLKRQRRLAILLSAVIAAMVADLVTMATVAIPLYLMYEFSILLIRLVGERRQPVAAGTPAPVEEASAAAPPEPRE